MDEDEKQIKHSESWLLFRKFRDMEEELRTDVDLQVLESIWSFFKPIAKGMSFGCTEIYGMYNIFKFKKAKQFALYFLLVFNEKVIKLTGLQ
ncbi:unnamed protein product [Blepharisma stoltei]|uniref:Uncharacterized protein n=1 Tax=Blepharisma stoltei TaxID=1481888 RepID=A0AAU9IVF0_9CILI|nr:unnamed protein product [Blepharisma stoltei]